MKQKQLRELRSLLNRVYLDKENNLGKTLNNELYMQIKVIHSNINKIKSHDYLSFPSLEYLEYENKGSIKTGS